jgi:hypothetical protein
MTNFPRANLLHRILPMFGLCQRIAIRAFPTRTRTVCVSLTTVIYRNLLAEAAQARSFRTCAAPKV